MLWPQHTSLIFSSGELVQNCIQKSFESQIWSNPKTELARFPSVKSGFLLFWEFSNNLSSPPMLNPFWGWSPLVLQNVNKRPQHTLPTALLWSQQPNEKRPLTARDSTQMVCDKNCSTHEGSIESNANASWNIHSRRTYRQRSTLIYVANSSSRFRTCEYFRGPFLHVTPRGGRNGSWGQRCTYPANRQWRRELREFRPNPRACWQLPPHPFPHSSPGKQLASDPPGRRLRVRKDR